MRSFPAVLLPLLALTALVACSDDEQPGDAATTASPAPTSEESSPRTTPGPSPGPPSPGPSSPPGATDSPGAASPGQVPRPAPGSCEPVPESADGRYVVADAGEVTLQLADGGLQLSVSSSNGWGTSVHSEDDEAAVEFSRDGEELDFEAGRQGGRVVLRICDDDD